MRIEHEIKYKKIFIPILYYLDFLSPFSQR